MTLDEPYYVRSRGRVQGPFTLEEVRLRAKRRKLNRFDQISTDGVNWSAASRFPELFPSPPQPAAPSPTPEPQSAESEGLVVEAQPVPGAAAGSNEYSVAPQAAPAEVQPTESEPLWHFVHGNREGGPVPFSQLQVLASQGQLAPDDYIWTEGMPDWVEAREVNGVFQMSATSWHEPQTLAPGTICPLAVISFILGLLGTSVLYFFGSIGAVICGHLALKQIRDSGDTLGGRGLALGGLILGYLVVVATTLIGVVLMFVSLLLGQGGAPG